MSVQSTSLHFTSLYLFTLNPHLNSLACNYILNPLSKCVPYDSHNNQFVFVTEMHHVLCDVETEFLSTLLYITLLCRWNSSLKGLSIDS